MQQDQRACSPDEPVMVAWRKFQGTDDYTNLLSWAGKHCVGELWGAFSQGFFASAPALSRK
jgi:hypothetical protein